jgi:hypothetical protein
VALSQNLHPSDWAEEIVMVQFKFVVVHMLWIGKFADDSSLLHTAL